MYAKLVNGTLRRAPSKVVYDGKNIYNPNVETLQELGYQKVVYIDMPTDAPEGQHYEPSWVQSENEIKQTWVLAGNPVYPDPEPTMKELSEAIERGITS